MAVITAGTTKTIVKIGESLQSIFDFVGAVCAMTDGACLVALAG